MHPHTYSHRHKAVRQLRTAQRETLRWPLINESGYSVTLFSELNLWLMYHHLLPSLATALYRQIFILSQAKLIVMKLQWNSLACPKRPSRINHWETTKMFNCYHGEQDKRRFWDVWLLRRSPKHGLDFTPCVSVNVRRWRSAAVTVSQRLMAVSGDGRVGAGLLVVVSVSMEAAWPWFTVTAAPGMWGQQARRAGPLPLIFICSTVCFAFQSLAEREALDTPWMAQEPVHILKT